ncbi:MAG: RecX family transcriptional regulator [Planctomycetota bacterium]
MARQKSRTLAPDPASVAEPDGEARVSRIRSVGADGSVVSVMVGRSSVAKIDAADVAKVGVRVGDDWTTDLAARLWDAARRLAAQRHALRLVAARPRARADLEQRLRRAGHAASDAAAAAEALEAAGIIDDAAFAEAAASTLAARKGSSRRAVETKLRKRGVAASDAAKAAAEATRDIDERQAAVDLAARRVARQQPPTDPHAARRRLYAFLIRRGFDHDDARHAVDRAYADRPHDLD